VTWAAISRLDRFTAGQKAEWRRQGELPTANARTGQALSLGLGLLAEVEAAEAAEGKAPELDLAKAAAATRRAPWLIVHGAEDETVPAAEAQYLAGLAGLAAQGSARAATELLIVPGASHTFGSRHPFAGPTPQLIQALNATQRWFRKHL
jgi:pimeloyl-ACP methyl ester carboxylesterase